MKYVKPRLHLLRLDDFNYPELHYIKHTEDYGNLDREELVSVFFRGPFAGRMSDHNVFQSSAYDVDFQDVRKHIDEFNRDLKGNWDKVILGLLEKQEVDLIDQISSRKESLKSVRKTMKKFGKDS